MRIVVNAVVVCNMRFLYTRSRTSVVASHQRVNQARLENTLTRPLREIHPAPDDPRDFSGRDLASGSSNPIEAAKKVFRAAAASACESASNAAIIEI